MGAAMTTLLASGRPAHARLLRNDGHTELKQRSRDVTVRLRPDGAHHPFFLCVTPRLPRRSPPAVSDLPKRVCASQVCMRGCGSGGAPIAAARKIGNGRTNSSVVGGQHIMMPHLFLTTSEPPISITASHAAAASRQQPVSCPHHSTMHNFFVERRWRGPPQCTRDAVRGP